MKHARVIFGIQFERRQRDNKQTYMKTEAYKLYSRDLKYFCQKSSKSILIIFSYTVSKLVRFLRHSVVSNSISFDLSWVCCTRSWMTNPQQIEAVEHRTSSKSCNKLDNLSHSKSTINPQLIESNGVRHIRDFLQSVDIRSDFLKLRLRLRSSVCTRKARLLFFLYNQSISHLFDSGTRPIKHTHNTQRQ